MQNNLIERLDLLVSDMEFVWADASPQSSKEWAVIRAEIIEALTITNEKVEAVARVLCWFSVFFPNPEMTLDYVDPEMTLDYVDEKWPRFKEEAIVALTAAFGTKKK